MDIETLTSGPGIVFTSKDFNECLNQFCADLVSFNEKEMLVRQRDHYFTVNHLKHLIYIKDSRIDGLKRKLKLV